MTTTVAFRFQDVISDICAFKWQELTRDELKSVACAYHYFSIQFCETVDIACALYPDDPQLLELRAGECDTDNLSPCAGIAEAGEKMNHDEFMRRVVAISDMEKVTEVRINGLGQAYLFEARRLPAMTRVMSLPSYEDGGLEKVFRAALRARDWDHPSLRAFRHFLEGHVRLDSDPDHGHGSLCRHLVIDDSILPLWAAFKKLLLDAVPSLAR